MAKDGVVSIAIDYKNELNQMIRDYESALTEMASSDKLSKGMKAQFDNTIAELKRFKADMEKSFSDLSIGKVDKNSFKAFKQTVNKNFESVRAEIDNLNLAVSTINSQIKILGNGVDISKISNQFKDFQDYVQNTNNAIDAMIKKLDGQGISLMSFDDSAVNQAKSQIKEINKLLKSTDEFSDAKGSKYELFDTDQAQAELDVLARDLKNTLELIEKSESELSNFDKNSIGFEKTINQINILKLKAADLHDSIQQLIDIPDKTGEYTFGDSILISDDDVDKKVSEYGKIVKDTLDEIRESAIKTREELEKIVKPTSSKTPSAKISDKLNPNSAELVTGVTIETTSSELWKKLSPILKDLQNDLNKNPVVAPVKLVVAPNAVSSDKKGEVGTVSKSYSKKYQRELAKTGEDAVIDLEGVYKKTFTSIMDEAVSYSKETISKIQNIFESSPIKLHFDFNEEEFKKISDTLLSSDSGEKIDITGQIAESKKEVNELAEKLTEVNELLNSADSKDFSFKGFDKFAEEISKSLGQLTELQSMLKTLQNIESTLARASGVSSVTDIETQWQNVSKLIENSIKLDGTFRKNANVDKLASEYNKYLSMGGTNELSSIGKVEKLENSKNIIDTILSKIKELNSQKVDTSSVEKADDELKSVSSTLDDVISRLDHMVNLTRDIGNTFWKMFKDASVSDVDKQWSSIESKFKSIADESGKINLSKQKKDIQELVEMYQKYTNAGGMKTPFDLTNNAETIKKMNKVYEQMNSKKDESSVESESKEFGKIEGSVNTLTSAINTKTEAIKTEANTMELAARDEVKSIQKIINALNPLAEKIENIPELKIPKEDTNLPSKESNISSGSNPAIEQQIKQQNKLQDEIRETIALTNEYGEVIDVYRGTHGLIGNGNVSNRYHGGTFWTSNRKLATQSYADGNKVTHANLYMRNPYLVHGGGADWDQLTLSIKQGEELEKHLENVYTSINDIFSKIQNTSGIEAGHLFEVFDGQLNFTDFENGIQKPIESLKDFQNIFESIDYDNSKIPQVQNYINQLYDLFTSYSRISQLSEKGILNTNEVVEIAKALKYDGVVFNGIRDGSDDSSDIFVTFEEKQSKVIDMITAAQLRAEEEQQLANILVNTRENLYKTLKSLDSKQVDEFIDKSAFNFVTDGSYMENLGEVLGNADPTDSIDNIKNKIREYINEVVNEFENAQRQIADSTDQTKDAFPDSSTNTKPETEGMEQVEKATEEAVQAKKDFTTANEGVQSSIDGSENPLKLEAELMEQIAKSAREAADAKKEFVEANKQVKESADGSNSENKKKDKYAKRSKIFEDDFLNNSNKYSSIANEKLSNSGYTILGGTVNSDLIDGLVKVSAKIKDVDGNWKTFSARIDADGNMFSQRFRTITKGVNNLDNELANFGKDKIKIPETDEQVQKFKELNTAIDDYASIRKRMANGKAFDNDKEDSQKLLKTINEIMGKADGSATILSPKQLSDTQDKLDKIDKTISEIQQKNAQKVDNSLLKIQNNATQKLSTYNDSSKYTPEFIKRVSSKISEIEQLDITKPEDVSRLKEIDSEVQKIVDDSKLLENKLVKQDSKIADIISQMKIFRSQNTNMSSSQKQLLSEMITYAERLEQAGKTTGKEFDDLRVSFAHLKADVASTGNMGKNFFSQIGNRLTDMNSKFVAQFLSWQDWIRYLQQASQIVTQINTNIVELAKVSEQSSKQIYADFDSYANIAKKMGSTISDTISATADWSRNGYNIPDAKELAEVALLYKNVGDGINIDEANESLISTLRGFKLEADQAEHVIDVFNEVSNNEAISSAGIGDALQRSAAAFNAANTSLEKSVALVTATNSVIQDPDKVGNMWKTVSARIRGAKTELTEMGEETDDMVESTSKLRSLVKGITGFDIMKDENTFKDIYDIVIGISEKWDSLNDIDQASLLESLAGKNQSNALAAALSNVDLLKKSYQEATNAEGSARKEQDEYAKSIQYSIDQAKASLEELANDCLSSDFLKGIISFGNSTISFLDDIIDKVGLLPTLLTPISAIIGKKLGYASI